MPFTARPIVSAPPVASVAFVAVAAAVVACLPTSSALRAEDDRRRDFAVYMQGKYLYERNCLLCHGARGDGRGEMAAELDQKPRSFREGLFKFRTTPYGALPTDEDLRHTIRSGLSNTSMPMFGHLRDEDIEALVAYVKSHSRAWRDESKHAEPMVFPAKPEWFDDESELESRAALGAIHFAAHCASCHGPEADGQGAAAAGLLDAWGHPSAPPDLRQPHLRDGGRPEDVYRILATGLNGTPMASFEETLSPDERWEIVAWLLRIRLPAPATLGGAPPRPSLLGKASGEP
jgi:mono/diheme cytochrome c family protein